MNDTFTEDLELAQRQEELKQEQQFVDWKNESAKFRKVVNKSAITMLNLLIHALKDLELDGIFDPNETEYNFFVDYLERRKSELS